MEKVNNKSILSLVWGVVSILVPFIGFIFGIIGLVMSFKSVKEINETKEKGIGLAIGGKITSIAGICYQLIIFVAVVGLMHITGASQSTKVMMILMK